jgi:hypothetical protein
MEDKKYTPWPNYKPHSTEATLEDHTLHHAPVGPTGHHTLVDPTHQHLPSDPRNRISENVNRLRQLRMKTDSLFLSLESDASADVTRLEHLAITYDVVGTALTLGAEIGLLIDAALKEGAKTIAKSKLGKEVAVKVLKEVAEELAKLPANRQADNLLLGNRLQHHLGTALHVWANFGPSYLASLRLQTKGKSLKEIARSADRIANSRPQDLLADSLSELRMQHLQTLQRIDQEIRKAEAQYGKI